MKRPRKPLGAADGEAWADPKLNAAWADRELEKLSLEFGMVPSEKFVPWEETLEEIKQWIRDGAKDDAFPIPMKKERRS